MSADRVLIIGAGITGLVCARELSKRGFNPLVLESSGRAGGKVLSPPGKAEGLVFEAGPDSFVTTKPHALSLAVELGLERELLTTNSEKRGMWVYSRGRLRRFPEGLLLMAPTRILPFLLSDIVPFWAKLRMAGDFFLPPGNAAVEESIGAFSRRRFGVEACETIIAPVMAGIHAGDPDRLSLAATFPQFAAMERSHGSVWRAMRSAASGRPAAAPGRSMFMTLKGGIESLARALAASLPPGTVRLKAHAARVEKAAAGYQAVLSDGETLQAARIVCTAPSNRAAALLAPIAPGLGQALASIPFASTATVSLAFAEAELPQSLVDGFGFVVDRREGKTISGATYSSTKFPGRVPHGTVLVRCFIGGAGRDAGSVADDAALIAAARRDLAEIAGIAGTPRESFVARWPESSPQYEVGHAARIEKIENALRGAPGLVLAGASYRGIGLPDCVRSGLAAASSAAAAELPAGAVV